MEEEWILGREEVGGWVGEGLKEWRIDMRGALNKRILGTNNLRMFLEKTPFQVR